MNHLLSPPESGPNERALAVMMEIDDIVIGEGRRPIDPAKVEAIASSIDDVGLLQYPLVEADTKILIAGRHRIAAFQLRGRTQIPVLLRVMDDVRAELSEIDENLHRHELTALQRATQLKRRKELYEELHPETAAGAAQATGVRRSCGQEVEPKLATFAQDTAAKVGLSDRTIRRDIQIATGLSEDVQERIRGTALEDSKADLVELIKLEPARQLTAVEAVLDGRAPNVAGVHKLWVREAILQKLDEGISKDAALEQVTNEFDGASYSVWYELERKFEVLKIKGKWRRASPGDTQRLLAEQKAKEAAQQAADEAKNESIREALRAFPADPFSWNALPFNWDALRRGLAAALLVPDVEQWRVPRVATEFLELPENWASREIDGLFRTGVVAREWSGSNGCVYTVHEELLAGFLPDESIKDQAAACKVLEATALARARELPLTPTPTSIADLHDAGHTPEQISCLSGLSRDEVWKLLESTGKVEGDTPEDHAELADQIDLVDADLLERGELEDVEAGELEAVEAEPAAAASCAWGEWGDRVLVLGQRFGLAVQESPNFPGCWQVDVPSERGTSYTRLVLRADALAAWQGPAPRPDPATPIDYRSDWHKRCTEQLRDRILDLVAKDNPTKDKGTKALAQEFNRPACDIEIAWDELARAKQIRRQGRGWWVGERH